ncbi:MAG TPA: helix-hairpin-helix domain-containing protein, partial [Candidatus Paceibacterota bacterium]
ECGGDGSIERIAGQSAHRCVVRDSQTLQKRKLRYFASKAGLDIAECGPKVIEALLNAGLISTFPDIFTLKKGDVSALPRFAEKSADNLLQSIEKAREITLPRLITGLSIDHVGEETSHLLAENFKTIDAVSKATVEELEIIPGIGTVVAESVFVWFRNTDNKKMLAKLSREIKIKKVAPVARSKLSGMTFVLTGTLPTLERAEIEDIIRKNGGSISSSVSKNTSYVLAGENPGSKLEKAQSLGVKVIGENEFKNLLL